MTAALRSGRTATLALELPLAQVGTPVERLLTRYTSLLDKAAVFVVGLAVLYLVGTLAVEPVARRLLRVRRIDPTVRRALERVLHAAVVFAAVWLSFAAAGVNVFRASATLAAALTVAIGFAARDVASNFVGGVFIVTDPKFNIGDWIQWGESEGIIEDITFRVTRVRTFDDELLTVPNSELATTAVTNPVVGRRLRVTHTFHVAYGDDIDDVTRILVETARGHADVLLDPEPTVRVVDADDSRVGVQVRFWIQDPEHADYVRIRSEFLRRATKRLREAGIELPPSW